MFIFTKQHAYTLKQIFFSFYRDLVHGTPWTSPPFRRFVSIANVVTFLRTTTVLSDKLSTFSCDHQNQLDKPSLMYCVTWLCKLFFVIWPVSRVLQAGTKISSWNELESKVIKMDWRTLHFNENFIFKKVYLIHGMQRLEWLWVFQPWFLSWNAGTTYGVIWSTISYPAKSSITS